MSETALLQIHTDGASRGNPGAAAFAYTIEGDIPEPVENAGCLGRMTNNQAEYTALVEALEHALEELGDGYRVEVYSDSELMVKQVNGEYRVKNEELRPLYEQARKLSDRFRGGLRMIHVRRGENARADALCNEALDGKRVAMPRAGTVAGVKPVPAEKAVSAPGPAASRGLRDEALACLRKAAESWAGGVLEPSPERVWAQLAELLRRRGVALPPDRR
jgi:ribonuclease HI